MGKIDKTEYRPFRHKAKKIKPSDEMVRFYQELDFLREYLEAIYKHYHDSKGIDGNIK